MFWGNRTHIEGWGGSHGSWLEENPSFTGNRQNGLSYDAAGNLNNDGSQTFSYDATGQQAYASATALTPSYDGDGLRFKKIENSATTYYLRSTVLGGQVVVELTGAGALSRGYVYLGGQMVAIQSGNAVSWVHQDPVTKSQRITNSAGSVTSTIDLDPWVAKLRAAVTPPSNRIATLLTREIPMAAMTPCSVAISRTGPASRNPIRTTAATT